MKLSTKRSKLEQAPDHSQHHAQAKNMAANLREKNSSRRASSRRQASFAQAAKPLEKLEEETEHLQDTL